MKKEIQKMSLYATERQMERQWLEVGGGVGASELFPTLLLNSKSVHEVDISTEEEDGTEESEGRYDGYSQHVPEDIQEQAELDAEQEFHGEALEAAKSFLQGIAPATSILREDFEEREQKVLEEAAKLLGIDVPWDAEEAARVQAEEDARIRKLEADKKAAADYLEAVNAAIATGDILPAFSDAHAYDYDLRQRLNKIVTSEMEKQLWSGKSRNEVAARFPGFEGPLGHVIGELRAKGVLPPKPPKAAAKGAV
jgi:hypothetical protein